MEYSMMTRLMWSAFSEHCIQAAQDLFMISDSSALTAKTKKNYYTVIDALPENTLSGRDISNKLLSAVCASTLMSLDSTPEKEQVDQFYNRAFGLSGNCPEGVYKMLAQFPNK